MVTENSDSKRDRGQLILIGAISIAFILLGVVVVFNSVQYTETVSSSESTNDLQDLRVVESELRTGLQVLEANEPIDEAAVIEYVETVYQPNEAKHRPVHITVENVDITADTVTIRYSTKGGTVTREVSW